jgi:alpha-L-rhamnosidase
MLLRAFACLLAGCALLIASARADVKALDLRTEWLQNPIGIDVEKPRFSWRVESETRGELQTAYRILVATSARKLAADARDIWDSGKVEGDATLGIVYGGRALAPGQQAFWKVKIWGKDGKESPWSEQASWSAGLFRPEHWRARWISANSPDSSAVSGDSAVLPAARYTRKSFLLKKPVARAVAYVSALGIYELQMNGAPVSDALFPPGWSDDKQRAYYRAVDVTSLLHEGVNSIGVIVANGWNSGWRHGGEDGKLQRPVGGTMSALLMQLQLEYSDETQETIGTNTSWEVSDGGPLRAADLLMGESYDATREQRDWAAKNGAPEWKWSTASLHQVLPQRVQSYPAQPIRVISELTPEKITEPEGGVFLVDVGQIIAGNLRLQIKGEAGKKVQLHYATRLNPDGRIDSPAADRAAATDDYLMRGDSAGETWAPLFTWRRFRYVEITGLAEKPASESVVALVLHNDLPLTSNFACSDERLNELFSRVVRAQRRSFLEVPTGSGEKEARYGAMGEAQLAARSATYHADVAAFFTKWLADVREAQRDSGAYPDFAPYPFPFVPASFTPGATDAGVICAWTMWKVYGDTRLLEQHWESMTRFMEWRSKRSPAPAESDTPAAPEQTPPEFLHLAYHALTARLMADMAAALEKVEEAERYAALFNEIRATFQKDYLSQGGALKVPTQTAHVLALTFALVPREGALALVEALAKMIEADGLQLTDATKSPLAVLSAMGYHDLAIRQLHRGTFAEEAESSGSLSEAAVGEWLFRFLVGIDQDGTGFQRLIIQPGLQTGGSEGQIDWVSAEYQSVRGTIATEWRKTAGQFELKLSIPANTTANVYLPAAGVESITDGGKPLTAVRGATFLRMEGSRAVLAVQSGSYSFAAALK